ncbi:hypothetical protein AB4254_08650 [Vibrio breoganii]
MMDSNISTMLPIILFGLGIIVAYIAFKLRQQRIDTEKQEQINIEVRRQNQRIIRHQKTLADYRKHGFGSLCQITVLVKLRDAYTAIQEVSLDHDITSRILEVESEINTLKDNFTPTLVPLFEDYFEIPLIIRDIKGVAPAVSVLMYSEGLTQTQFKEECNALQENQVRLDVYYTMAVARDMITKRNPSVYENIKKATKLLNSNAFHLDREFKRILQDIVAEAQAKVPERTAHY